MLLNSDSGAGRGYAPAGVGRHAGGIEAPLARRVPQRHPAQARGVRPGHHHGQRRLRRAQEGRLGWVEVCVVCLVDRSLWRGLTFGLREKGIYSSFYISWTIALNFYFRRLAFGVLFLWGG